MRQTRVPEPIISQVNQLIELYQDDLEQGGATGTPPKFIGYKPVNKFMQGR